MSESVRWIQRRVLRESGPLSLVESWKVFHEFIAVCDPEELIQAYGWDPPVIPALTFGERVTAYYMDDILAGWRSIKLLPTRRGNYEVILGVFPEYRGQGIGARMLEDTITWAQRWGVETLMRVIAGSNPRRLRTLLSQDLAGSVWRYAGCEWHPEYRYFFTWVNPKIIPTVIGPGNPRTALELRKLDEYEALEMGG